MFFFKDSTNYYNIVIMGIYKIKTFKNIYNSLGIVKKTHIDKLFTIKFDNMLIRVNFIANKIKLIRQNKNIWCRFLKRKHHV